MCKMMCVFMSFVSYSSRTMNIHSFIRIALLCFANVHLCPHSMVVISQPMNEQTNQPNEWILDKSYLSIHKTIFFEKKSHQMCIVCTLQFRLHIGVHKMSDSIYCLSSLQFIMHRDAHWSHHIFVLILFWQSN